MNPIDMILYLAERGALFEDVDLSTIEVSKYFPLSQQSISRIFRNMEAHGLIDRLATPKTTRIRLTEKSKVMLKEYHRRLETVLSQKKINFTGIVRSGLGEGGYYVSLPAYLQEFKRKLGFVPFKGTLNVEVEDSSLEELKLRSEPIIISGFTESNRTFGKIYCYKIKIEGLAASIVIPERTSHKKNIIEIISKDFLRKRLNLEDGKMVTIST